MDRWTDWTIHKAAWAQLEIMFKVSKQAIGGRQFFLEGRRTLSYCPLSN